MINAMQYLENVGIATKIFWGENAFCEFSEQTKGHAKVFYLSCGKAEIDNAVIESLAGRDVFVMNLPEGSVPCNRTAERIASHIKEGTTLLIACGGGSCCDIAKLVAVREGIEFCFLPVAPTNDGLLTDFAVTTENGMIQKTKAKAPDFLVVHKTQFSGITRKQLRSGFGDVVANYLSVLDFAVSADFYSERFDLVSAELALCGADRAVIAGKMVDLDEEKCAEGLFAATLLSSAAMAVYGSSVPCCGGEHAMAIAIDSLLPSAGFSHGESVFLAFCRVAEAYNLLFSLHGSSKYLPPDTSSRCDFLVGEMGISDEVAEKYCKEPISEGEYMILREKFRICKEKNRQSVAKICQNLNHLKQLFFKIDSSDIERFNIPTEVLEKALAIAPDMMENNSALSVMREFGLLEGLLAE